MLSSDGADRSLEFFEVKFIGGILKAMQNRRNDSSTFLREVFIYLQKKVDRETILLCALMYIKYFNRAL